MNINYKTNTATEKEIRGHLHECNENFIPPLNSRVDLEEFSKKMFEKSITFEAWEDGVLAGMLSAYFNDTDNYLGYITNVSVMKNYTGMGIASVLLGMCIDYAKEHHFKGIKLEVHKENSPAIKLYNKFGFQIFENNNNFVIMRFETNLN